MDYKQVILDHYKSPSNMGVLTDPDVEVNEANSSCGDVIKVQLRVVDNKIMEMKWQSIGCAVSTATASILSEKVCGMSLDDARLLNEENIKDMVGDINAGRIKCATLPLRALLNAIEKYGQK